MDEQQNQTTETSEPQPTNSQVQTWAVSILVAAARMGQQKGVFSLEEAAMVSKAVSVFAPAAPVSPPEENAEELTATTPEEAEAELAE